MKEAVPKQFVLVVLTLRTQNVLGEEATVTEAGLATGLAPVLASACELWKVTVPPSAFSTPLLRLMDDAPVVPVSQTAMFWVVTSGLSVTVTVKEAVPKQFALVVLTLRTQNVLGEEATVTEAGLETGLAPVLASASELWKVTVPPPVFVTPVLRLTDAEPAEPVSQTEIF